LKAPCSKCGEIKDINYAELCTTCRELEKLIDKIKKLLALSKSPNEAEAELAAQRAHEILTKYKLSMDDVEEKEIREGNVITGRSLKKWRHILIDNIAKYYYCQCLQYEGDSGYYRIVFIGQKHNIIICKSMYDYLEKSILRECRNIHKNAKYKYRETFKLGMVLRISERLKEFSKITNTDERALVITENKLIEKYLENKEVYTQKIDYDLENINAYMKGKMAGNKVSLNGQVKNNTTSTKDLPRL
jgi:hypothetical protein